MCSLPGNILFSCKITNFRLVNVGPITRITIVVRTSISTFSNGDSWPCALFTGDEKTDETFSMIIKADALPVIYVTQVLKAVAAEMQK